MNSETFFNGIRNLVKVGQKGDDTEQVASKTRDGKTNPSTTDEAITPFKTSTTDHGDKEDDTTVSSSLLSSEKKDCNDSDSTDTLAEQNTSGTKEDEVSGSRKDLEEADGGSNNNKEKVDGDCKMDKGSDNSGNVEQEQQKETSSATINDAEVKESDGTRKDDTSKNVNEEAQQKETSSATITAGEVEKLNLTRKDNISKNDKEEAQQKDMSNATITASEVEKLDSTHKDNTSKNDDEETSAFLAGIFEDEGKETPVDPPETEQASQPQSKPLRLKFKTSKRANRIVLPSTTRLTRSKLKKDEVQEVKEVQEVQEPKERKQMQCDRARRAQSEQTQASSSTKRKGIQSESKKKKVKITVKTKGRTNTKQAVGKQAVGKQAVGKQAVGKQAVGKQAVGKKAVGKKTVGKKTVGKKAVGKKAVGKKTVAKKTLPKKTVKKSPHPKNSKYALPEPSPPKKGRRGVWDPPITLANMKDRTARKKCRQTVLNMRQLQFQTTWEAQRDREDSSKPVIEHFMYTYDELVPQIHNAAYSRWKRNAPVHAILHGSGLNQKLLGERMIKVGKALTKGNSEEIFLTSNPEEYLNILYGKEEEEEKEAVEEVEAVIVNEVVNEGDNGNGSDDSDTSSEDSVPHFDINSEVQAGDV